MKILVAFKFSGEKQENLENILTPIINSFKEKGIDAYCNFFDEELNNRSKNFKERDWMIEAFKKLKDVDFLFVILTSQEKSEGMIMEIGYCLAKNIPIVIAIKDEVANTYLPEMANLVIRWKRLDELLNKIALTDFVNIKS